MIFGDSLFLHIWSAWIHAVSLHQTLNTLCAYIINFLILVLTMAIVVSNGVKVTSIALWFDYGWFYDSHNQMIMQWFGYQMSKKVKHGGGDIIRCLINQEVVHVFFFFFFREVVHIFPWPLSFINSAFANQFMRRLFVCVDFCMWILWQFVVLKSAWKQQNQCRP